MPLITVRGTAIVDWRPAWTLTLTSPDGLSLDADGESHVLQARLTHTVTGDPIPNRQILLQTVPFGEVGNGELAFTNAAGIATFTVSNEDTESVEYTAQVATSGNIDDTLTIQWGQADGLLFVPESGYYQFDEVGNRYFYLPSFTVVLVTCTLTSGGSPVVGANLDFIGIASNCTVLPISNVTDVNGQFVLTCTLLAASGSADLNMALTDPPFTLFLYPDDAPAIQWSLP